MAEEAAVVNEPVVADTTPTESTTEETQSAEVVDEQAKADKAVADSFLEDETEDEGTPEKETESEETKPEEQPQNKGAEDRKQQLSNEIRDLVSQRNTIRQEVEKLNAQVYQPATEDELLEQVNPETGENYNRLEAKLAAMEQSQEIERYNTQVAEAQLTLGSEAKSALKDFPMFDKDSKEFRPEIAASADKILGANLIYDENTGQVIGSNVSPYELYKSFADAARLSAEQGQIKGQRATEQMLARSDSSSSAAPAKQTEDNFLKGLRG